jgi:hypothetical protein
MRYLVVFLTMVLLGCGGVESALEDQQKQQQQDKVSTDKLGGQQLSADAVPVNGYISPMNISVDGVEYVDSEDFYTQEVDRLTQMAQEQYPEHKLFFDAEVGLRDLKRDMSVYLAASGDEGFADETMVNGKGQFLFNLPANTDLKQSYVLRAYKRIGLRLEKGSNVISWCYNLFAQKEVLLEKDKQLILRDFSTKVTKYQCATQKKSGITLPYPDMPGVPVYEAFENAETWPGYGPAPKPKTQASGPANDSSGGMDEKEDEIIVQDDSEQISEKQ